jgi:glycerol-3-phosphate dehydrogenase (NAD(P)+)
MATIAVVGSGMMGTALAWPFVDCGHAVRLVGSPLDDTIIESLKERGHHPTLSLDLPSSSIEPYFSVELPLALQGADAIVLGVSSAGVRWAGGAIGPHLHPGQPVLMISKGLEWSESELRVLPDVLARSVPAAVREGVSPVGVTGPCIAGELARRVPTAVLFAGRDETALERLRELCECSYYHVRLSTDVIGAEVCAALKNAFAMGIALASGLHEAAGGAPGSIALHNYESAVLTQSILEMQRLVSALGGDPATAVGLAGVGDLDVTCNGGRTGRFGRLLGLGLSRDRAVEQMRGATLECLDVLATLRDALPALERRGAIQPGALPLLDHLVAVGLDGVDVNMPFERFYRE